MECFRYTLQWTEALVWNGREYLLGDFVERDGLSNRVFASIKSLRQYYNTWMGYV